jgi:hypothetical protein
MSHNLRPADAPPHFGLRNARRRPALKAAFLAEVTRVKDQIDLKGATGAVYRFRLAENGDPKTTISGNYAYVRAGDGLATVLFVGETVNLASGVRDRWTDAVAKHGATHIFIRLNVSGAARANELADLLEALNPVMNAKG